MPKPVVANDFLDLLEKSQLLSPDEYEAACAKYDLRELPSGKHVARKLVEAGLLTTYQAERLLLGRSRGFLIDRYKVLAILGFGGMGRIYVAKDLESGEKVALKVLTERHEVDASMLERLKLEAKAGLQLDHPRVVRTRELGHTGAVTYVVMEYVEGLTLHEIVVTRGPMAWPQACDVIAQAASGLHHAHKAGLVHRDIKPANLIVTNDGQAKILDFGLALLQDDEEAEFALAMIFGHDCLGTADYISPEQSLHSHDVDARADIYSLGCTFYYLLTGQVPFPLKTVAEKLVAQRMKTPPPVTNYVSDIPPAVMQVLAKMMAKKPEDRYQTAGEAAEALAAHAKRAPIPFDFGKILEARAREASRRMKANEKSRRSSGQSSTTASQPSSRSVANSSITAGGASNLSTQRLQNQVETDIDVSRQKPASEKKPKAEPPPDEFGRTSTMRAAETSLPAPVPAVLVPEDGGTPIFLDRHIMKLGRSSECEIPVSQQGISSKHCEFCFEGNWWKVTDLESKNGVQVNGTDVSSRMLMPGDRLTIARKYHFRIEDPSAEKSGTSPLTFWLWILALLLFTSLSGFLASQLM